MMVLSQRRPATRLSRASSPVFSVRFSSAYPARFVIAGTSQKRHSRKLGASERSSVPAPVPKFRSDVQSTPSFSLLLTRPAVFAQFAFSVSFVLSGRSSTVITSYQVPGAVRTMSLGPSAL